MVSKLIIECFMRSRWPLNVQNLTSSSLWQIWWNALWPFPQTSHARQWTIRTSRPETVNENWSAWCQARDNTKSGLGAGTCAHFTPSASAATTIQVYACNSSLGCASKGSSVSVCRDKPHSTLLNPPYAHRRAHNINLLSVIKECFDI